MTPMLLLCVSRFGKLITMYFDPSGNITGGSVVSYLLEKSRVVYQVSQQVPPTRYYLPVHAAVWHAHSSVRALTSRSLVVVSVSTDEGGAELSHLLPAARRYGMLREYISGSSSTSIICTLTAPNPSSAALGHGHSRAFLISFADCFGADDVARCRDVAQAPRPTRTSSRRCAWASRRSSRTRASRAWTASRACPTRPTTR